MDDDSGEPMDGTDGRSATNRTSGLNIFVALLLLTLLQMGRGL